MPVKIQELVIQVKVNENKGLGSNAKHPSSVSYFEWQRLKESLLDELQDTIADSLQERKER